MAPVMAPDMAPVIPDDGRCRCAWANADPLSRAYHDDEWGVPERDPRALWEMLMLEGFQAGLSWITILRKRPAFRAAFAGFDPDAVAAFGPDDVERLMQDAGIVRARAKIEATIGNARAYVAMRAAGEDFAAFAWAHVDGAPIRTRRPAGERPVAHTPLAATVSKALRSRGFRFVGPTTVYAWMQATGLVDDHDAGCFRADATAAAKAPQAALSQAGAKGGLTQR
ncbi:DNA-3-methyladenine glycosylase I [Acidisphaera rubrifaciens]|uniref:DNA-3-methyladenine glycosylase I n=1 Tax=Acidisphaera rubrifaciens HS-AP3 TaxID=1231350 RepID=A0A0D6P6Q9_9PROT|nr:DNA-3-methyladenine glycosylase I [Acidisphaera rubrifaciens]GAN77347.1 DNA-3-methyladenine glycosylase I [Acidisphaera rubrifaciens HS-AP3]